MGAGCYYTHNNGERAYWIEIPYSEDSDEWTRQDEWNDFIEEVKSEFVELGYDQDSEYEFSNGLYNIRLESTHCGNGMIIYIDEKGERRWDADDQRIYNLASSNFMKAERRIALHFNKFYTMCIATSGYMAHRIGVNQLKKV